MKRQGKTNVHHPRLRETVDQRREAGSQPEPRVPLRPESPKEEIERYPGRLEHYERCQRIVAERAGHLEEDAAHRRTCEDRRCQHPAHVRPRRALKSETRDDRRHLGAYTLEDPVCDHDAHLLPPHPLDLKEEFCCEEKHFPRDSIQALTECPMVPAQLKARRQAELRAFGLRAFGQSGSRGRFATSTLVVTDRVTGKTIIDSR